MSTQRQYELARKLVDVAVARLRDLESLSVREQDIYLRGLRDGFKLCGAEMLAAAKEKS